MEPASAPAAGAAAAGAVDPAPVGAAVARLLVASHYMRDLLAQNGLAAGRITVLPHFAQLPAAPQPVDAPADGPHLLFAGRLEEEKGLPYLLRALARVNRPYRLLVAGDGRHRADYEALAQQLGIAGRVTFLGWLNQTQLEQLYRQVACLVLPSIQTIQEEYGNHKDSMNHG